MSDLNPLAVNPLAVHPLACGAFLIAAFAMAGVAHVVWLKHPVSARFAVPIDRGRTFRGRRLLGDNKTLRGFMVMVPATGLAFALLALTWKVWPLATWRYALVGVAAGFGFMAGELPNSFVKRQLGIEPGTAPAGGWRRLAAVLADRLDSLLGALLVVSLLIELPWQTWLWLLVLAPLVHALFSYILFALGVKNRAG